MSRKDQLASGQRTPISYGPVSVSSQKWERIFGPPEVGLYKKKIRKPKAAPKEIQTINV